MRTDQAPTPRYSMARTNVTDIICLCPGKGWGALQSMARSPGAPSIAQLGEVPMHLSLTPGLERRY